MLKLPSIHHFSFCNGVQTDNITHSIIDSHTIVSIERILMVVCSDGIYMKTTPLTTLES